MIDLSSSETIVMHLIFSVELCTVHVKQRETNIRQLLWGFPVLEHLTTVAKQQWNFPSYVGTLYLHLGVTSVSKLAGCGQPKPVPAGLV